MNWTGGPLEYKFFRGKLYVARVADDAGKWAVYDMRFKGDEIGELKGAGLSFMEAKRRAEEDF